MAAKGIEQRHLVLLYQSAVVSVTDYGLGLTTMAQTKLLKLDRVQNEAMRVTLGTTRDTCTSQMDNNGTDKSAKAGQSAERGNASHTGNHQGHMHP